jgi:predicted DNA-binding protein
VIYMQTTTIRVAMETRDRLNALARRRGATAGEIVAELVRSADEDALLEAAAEGWRRLDVAAYRAETRALAVFETPPPPY